MPDGVLPDLPVEPSCLRLRRRLVRLPWRLEARDESLPLLLDLFSAVCSIVGFQWSLYYILKETIYLITLLDSIVYRFKPRLRYVNIKQEKSEEKVFLINKIKMESSFYIV